MIFNFNLSTYKKQDGTKAIRLRIATSSRDNQFIKTDIFLLSHQWDSKKQKVKRHPLEEKLNAKLQSLKTDVQNVFFKNTGVSAKTLLERYKAKNTSLSFLDYYQDVVDEMKLKQQISTAKTNQKYITKLKKYSNEIYFSDLTPIWIKRYELWMLNRGNQVNTIASNFKSINAVLNKALKAGVIESNPIKSITIKTENTKKESLTLEEIERLKDLKIEPRFKGLIMAKDMFLFSFYTAGMRFTDICKLKSDDVVGDNIIYIMSKAKNRKGAKRIIPLNKFSKKIIDKYKGSEYVFPVLNGITNVEMISSKIYIKNNNINRALKTLACKCDINKSLSMHIAKHSFTDYAVKSNVDLLMISKLLGHTKLSTTEYYLKDFYQKEQSEVIKKMFDLL